MYYLWYFWIFPAIFFKKIHYERYILDVVCIIFNDGLFVTSLWGFETSLFLGNWTQLDNLSIDFGYFTDYFSRRSDNRGKQNAKMHYYSSLTYVIFSIKYYVS